MAGLRALRWLLGAHHPSSPRARVPPWQHGVLLLLLHLEVVLVLEPLLQRGRSLLLGH